MKSLTACRVTGTGPRTNPTPGDTPPLRPSAHKTRTIGSGPPPRTACLFVLAGTPAPVHHRCRTFLAKKIYHTYDTRQGTTASPRSSTYIAAQETRKTTSRTARRAGNVGTNQACSMPQTTHDHIKNGAHTWTRVTASVDLARQRTQLATRSPSPVGRRTAALSRFRPLPASESGFCASRPVAIAQTLSLLPCRLRKAGNKKGEREINGRAKPPRFV